MAGRRKQKEMRPYSDESSSGPINAPHALHASSTSTSTPTFFSNDTVSVHYPYNMLEYSSTSQTSPSTTSVEVEESSTVADSRGAKDNVPADVEQAGLPYIAAHISHTVPKPSYDTANLDDPSHSRQVIPAHGLNSTEDVDVPTESGRSDPEYQQVHPLCNIAAGSNASSMGIPYDYGPSISHPNNMNSSPPNLQHPYMQQTQLNSWLYAVSKDSLTFSEWSLKKRDWERQRYEKL